MGVYWYFSASDGDGSRFGTPHAKRPVQSDQTRILHLTVSEEGVQTVYFVCPFSLVPELHQQPDGWEFQEKSGWWRILVRVLLTQVGPHRNMQCTYEH